MRVCSPELGISADATLGGAVYDRESLTALAAIGVDVSILLPEGESVPQVDGWDVTRTPRHRRSYYEYNYIFNRALWREWRRRPFDVLRVHSPYSVGIGALAFARRTGVPTVLHYLHVEPRALWSIADRWTLHRYTHVIAISEATRTQLLRLYDIPPDRITVVRPGVGRRYSPGQQDAGLLEKWAGARVALYIGSLIPRKNLDVAIRAIARLRRDGMNVRLVIAGSGTDQPRLQRLAGELALGPGIEFSGQVTEAHKLALLRTADAFVFPSRLEGFGMVAAEAMACGVPVVAFNDGPVTEFVVDGVGGLLVDRAAPEPQFAEALGRILENVALRQRLGSGAIAAAAALSWDRSAHDMLRIYQRVSARVAS